MVDFNEEKQEKRLAEIRHKEEEALVQSLAQKAGVAYVDLSGIGIETDALRVIPEEDARRHEVAAFKIVGKELHVAARSPRRQDTLDLVQKLLNQGFNVTLYMVSTRSLEKAWLRYQDISEASSSRGSFLDISDESLQKIANQIKTNKDIKNMFEGVSEKKAAHRISKLIEIIFGSGIATDASDIHIEPQDEQVRLRLRQDGVLHDVLTFDHETHRSINSRIKLLSGLKLTQTENAQDGRFTIDYQGKEIEIRTSVIPGGYGESIVMRILNPDNINVGMEDLGIETKLLNILKKEIGKPNGLILTTGPTGSGKTTTLYSFLKYIYNPEIKILTIEDPIEYHLQGITQTQVDHKEGYTFLSGLRAALRQDPDVVMVGEIRDQETASIAVNAALTGHLVLSTLHTNNAAGAIPRLIDLGVNPGILAAALSTSIAQRLVRKLCKACKKERPANEAEKQLLQAVIQQAIDTGKDVVAHGIDISKQITVWEPVGCDDCGGIGYKGRIGVYEAILNDKFIQQILESRPSEREVKITSAKQGILTMKEDGVIKILNGVTSLEEVQKVVDLEEDLNLFDGRPSEPEPVRQAPPQITTPEPKPEPVPTPPPPPVAPTPAPEPTPVPPPPVVSPEPEPESKPKPEPAPEPKKKSHEKTSSKKTKKVHKKSNKTLHETIAEAIPEQMPQAMQTDELSLLVDYLKMLEQEQERNPEIGISYQIKRVRETILGLLKTGAVVHLMDEEKENEKAMHKEIELLVDELQKLEHEQAVAPDVGIAKKLKKIRATIENL